jgi:hypothetical protein
MPGMRSYLCQGGHNAFVYLQYNTTHVDPDLVCLSNFPIPYNVRSYGRVTHATVPGTLTVSMLMYMPITIGRAKAEIDI